MSRARWVALGLLLALGVGCTSEDAGPEPDPTPTTAAVQTTTIDEPVEHEPEPVSSVDAGPNTRIAIHRPLDDGPRPVVLVYGPSNVPTDRYRQLAEALLDEGAVVGLVDYDAAAAPISSACAAETTARWAEENDIEISGTVALGFGNGVALAVGEALEGPWIDWSPNPLCNRNLLDAPSTLIGIGGDFSAFESGDPMSQGLSPFDQVGGNQYLDVRVMAGSSATGEGNDASDFVELLRNASYSVDLQSVVEADEDLASLGSIDDDPVPDLIAEIVAIVVESATFASAGG